RPRVRARAASRRPRPRPAARRPAGPARKQRASVRSPGQPRRARRTTARSRGPPPHALPRPRPAPAPARASRPRRPRAAGRGDQRAPPGARAALGHRRGRRDRRRTTRRSRGCRDTRAPGRGDRPPLLRRQRRAASGPAHRCPAGRRAPAPRGRRAGRARGSPAMNGVLGWDIGGVNTKVARVAGARVLAAHAAPYELQRNPAALAPLLAHLARDVGAGPADPHGVTMTAELSQLFRTKREGELVYTGALRTPVEAIAPTVPVRGRPTGVAAEGFALAGDVHVWRGELAPADYSVPTPDGRPTTREFAGERLARVVCADREMLDEPDIGVIADALWEAQVTRIGAGLERARAR